MITRCNGRVENHILATRMANHKVKVK